MKDGIWLKDLKNTFGEVPIIIKRALTNKVSSSILMRGFEIIMVSGEDTCRRKSHKVDFGKLAMKRTSIWFDTKLKTYLLPIKAEIRKFEYIEVESQLPDIFGSNFKTIIK